jgi:hypothetical protein
MFMIKSAELGTAEFRVRARMVAFDIRSEISGEIACMYRYPRSRTC